MGGDGAGLGSGGGGVVVVIVMEFEDPSARRMTAAFYCQLRWWQPNRDVNGVFGLVQQQRQN